jgi:probable phosphoglycerate mutase
MTTATTTTLVLVRHGETLGNRDRRFQTYDTPLSDTGRAQAERVAERLAADGPFHALYTSDLARTRETAAAIVARTSLTPHFTPALRELDTGDFKGTLRDEIDAVHPGRLQGWIDAGGVERMPGTAGECVADVHARTAAFLAEVCARHPGERVLLVSHGWALSILLYHVHGWDHTESFAAQRIHLNNTAVSVVEVDADGARRCTLLGCTAHLEAVGSGQP